MRPLPSGWRLAGFVFIWAVIFALGSLIGWFGNQPVAGALSALIAVALFVRGLVAVARLKKAKQTPKPPSDAGDLPRWGR